MNDNFPPLQLGVPTYLDRRPEKPRRSPIAAEVLARRVEIARILEAKVEPLNLALRNMTEEQRKAVFYKVSHDGPITLPGTGLKPLVDRSDRVTLVVPRHNNLDALTNKIQEFATEPPRRGFIKNQDLARVQDIQPGKPHDRLSDELVAKYSELCAQQYVICEIEIISLANGANQQRDEIAGILSELKTSLASGVHGTIFEHEENAGACRAVIRVTGAMFRRLVEESYWQRRIAWFEPKPRFETFQTVWQNFNFAKLQPIASPSSSASTVCIVDSGVSPGNPFLAPVAREELFRSFLNSSPDRPYDENGHGSGVASLAAYYALNLDDGAENRARAWIASARILGADNQIEEERLFSKVIDEVVTTFVSLGVRIFNLSVNDIAKRWNQDTRRTQPRTSWTARTLDRLSRQHDIVFVVSTGNIACVEVRDFLQASCDYPLYLCDEASRILDPGQASLALTIGSIAPGTMVVSSSDTAIAMELEPSPFTRCGPGMKGETKPELVDFGGNLVRDQDATWVRSNSGTDVVMASHQLSPAVAHSYGTSFAAPRVAHKLAVLLSELTELGVAHISAPLLKAFLVNSSAHRGDMSSIMAGLSGQDPKKWLDVLGHGFSDPTRATDCDEHSVILFHQGMLATNQVAYFDIPIPASLARSSSKKRLTVTTAHYPEVQKWGLESYLGVNLKWKMFRGDISREEITLAMSSFTPADAETDEADEPVLPSELAFNHRVTRRSRGTVQHDWLEWTQHRSEFSTNHYTLAIASYKRWQRIQSPVPYAVVVRIEDLGASIPVYIDVASLLVPVELNISAIQ